MESNNENAVEFKIQNGVVTECLWRQNPGIHNLTIPDGVTAVAADINVGCKIRNFTIPSGVTSICKLNAEGLENIIVDGSNRAYCSIDGVLFNKDKTVLVRYPPGRKGSYNIPSGVTAIGADAFDWCEGLTGVTICAAIYGLRSYISISSINNLNDNLLALILYIAIVTGGVGGSIGSWRGGGILGGIAGIATLIIGGGNAFNGAGIAGIIAGIIIWIIFIVCGGAVGALSGLIVGSVISILTKIISKIIRR